MIILVTGAAGFIGFNTVERFLKDGHMVIGVDSINSYYNPKLKFARLMELGIGQEAVRWNKPVKSLLYPKFTFIRAKLEDRQIIEQLFSTYIFDRVVHLAAQAGVRYSLDHPYEYIDSNIVGFLGILEGCRHQKVPHLVYASSSSVYGLNGIRPFSTHDHTDHPASLYAATKKANELMAHTYSYLYGFPTTGLRFFTVYGPWGRPDMAYYKFAQAIVENKPIDVYNNGNMWRDFTFIDDIVEGIVRVTADIPTSDKGWDPKDPDPASSSASYRIYNIGNNRAENLLDFIRALEAALGKKAFINFKPMQPGDLYATEADVEDLEKAYRWKPKTNIQEGIRKFVKWFREFYGEINYI